MCSLSTVQMQMLSIIIMMPQYTGHGTRVTRVLIEYGADKSAISRASGLRVSRRNNNSEPQLHPETRCARQWTRGGVHELAPLLPLVYIDTATRRDNLEMIRNRGGRRGAQRRKESNQLEAVDRMRIIKHTEPQRQREERGGHGCLTFDEARWGLFITQTR